jgi:colicin import membrane protein
MDQFNRFVSVSLVLHLSLLLLWAMTEFWFPPKKISYEKALRVDIVGLPEKNTEVLKPEESKGETKQDFKLESKQDFNEEPKQESKALHNQNSSTQEESSQRSDKKEKIQEKAQQVLDQKSLDRQFQISQNNKSGDKSKSKKEEKKNVGDTKLSQLSALEKLEESFREEEEQKKALKKMLFKGNTILEGSHLSGLDKVEAENYIEAVEAHVRGYWKLPQWLSQSQAKARVLVKWDSQGIPVLIQIVESSGQEEFDQVVMTTLQKATPFPEPPEKFVLVMRRQGVVFGFPD